MQKMKNEKLYDKNGVMQAGEITFIDFCCFCGNNMDIDKRNHPLNKRFDFISCLNALKKEN